MFQEARDKKTRKQVIDNVLMCSSACAHHGSLGCSVWISLAIPWFSVEGKHFKIKRDNVNIIYADPRLLLVCCCSRNFKACIVSAHAPYVGCRENFSDWWKHFRSSIFKYCVDGVPRIAGIDANYQCHDNEVEFIGDLGVKSAITAPKNHDDFVDSVSELKLYVSNSFRSACEASYVADMGTYVSKANEDKGTRIGYILHSGNVKCSDSSIASDRGIVFNEGEEGHIPLFGRFVSCVAVLRVS